MAEELLDTGVKQFFHIWCSKKGKSPNYAVRPGGGPRHRQRFLCELRVDGIVYTACGNSTSKKAAETNAAHDFLQFLIRSGEVNASEVPSLAPPGDVPPAALPSQAEFQPPQQPQAQFIPVRDAYKPFQGEPKFMSNAELAREVAEAEGVDMNAKIHGNWTLDNSKAKLNEFMSQRRIKADYVYEMVGPDHNRTFVASMGFYVKELGRNIHARETGSTKQSASRSCALSLVRQLFHLNVIPANAGLAALSKKDKNKLLIPFDVNLEPNLVQKISDALDTFGIQPVDWNVGDPQAGVPLIPSHPGSEFPSSGTKSPAGIISWAPPIQNWNPWTACNIDEGPMASLTLDQISDQYEADFKEVRQADKHYQRMTEYREQLPVFGSKDELLRTIQDNPVVIVRGSTGCGKTTQIPQFILDDYLLSGQGAYCNIVVTQPRRISAVSVADRVANERSEELGMSCGYSVRFESVLPRPYGSVMYCTVGVLLRRLEKGLRGVSHVIVDEIHERDVNTDFLMVVLRDVVNAFPDLRVILMSATVDTTMFSSYFGNCPVIEVPGKVHPVDVFYLEDIVETLGYFPSEEFQSKNAEKKGKKRKLDEDDVNDDDNEGGTADAEDCNVLVSQEYMEQTRASVAAISEKDNMNFELMEKLIEYIETMEAAKEGGAILCFFPGWNSIFTALKHFQSHPKFGSGKYVFLPLHSNLPREDQRRVFDHISQGSRKIIFSTNIAESSITIDDVVFVMDSCKAKMKLFTSHNNMTNYATVWASKSNLDQRKGRAGRVRPGYCFRFISKARHEKLEEHITPEILRSPLHEIALSIKLLHLGDIQNFLSKAIEPPPLDAVIEGIVILKELQALDRVEELTPLGHILARLPIEPRLGKMVVLACVFGLGDAACCIAAHSSSFQEIFLLEGARRLSFRQRNMAGVRSSDHFALLNAFGQWEAARYRGENSEINFCDSQGLSMPMLRVTWEAKNQLRDLLFSAGFPESCLFLHHFDFYGYDEKLDLLAAILACGLYPNVCCHREKRLVLTTDMTRALICKTSVNCPLGGQDAIAADGRLFPYPFFVFGEKVRTRAVACKQMTMVSPIHLLLFGCQKIEYCAPPPLPADSADAELILANEYGPVVKLDGWIQLKMDPQQAAFVAALRPAIESLVVDAASDPSSLLGTQNPEEEVSGETQKLRVRIQALKAAVGEACMFGSGRFQLEEVDLTRMSRLGSKRPPRSNAFEDARFSGANRGFAHFSGDRGRGYGFGGYRGNSAPRFGGGGGRPPFGRGGFGGRGGGGFPRGGFRGGLGPPRGKFGGGDFVPFGDRGGYRGRGPRGGGGGGSRGRYF